MKFCSFFTFSSDYQKSIAVRTELVVHLKGCLICLHDIFIASESGYGHEHCRARAMEIGYDRVRNGEPVRREDEFVGPSVIWVHLVVGGHICLESSDGGYSHCKYLMAASLCVVDEFGCLRSDYESL